MIAFGAYRVDRREGRVWCDDREVALRPKAWALLLYLLERPGVLVTKDELLAAVWSDAIVSDDTLTTTLGELRRALGDSAQAPRVVQTVHRRGFRFVGALQPLPEARAEAPGGFEARPSEPAGRTFVGREAELANLLDAWGAALEGQRQVVFVRGEAGIGKSTLVDAFLRQACAASPAPLVGYGQYVEQYGGREPYMAVLDALERLSQGEAGERVRAALRAVAPNWLAQMPALQREGDAEWLRRQRADATPQRMLREFAGLAESISLDRPLILVLEDLHWSDQGTVDLVSVLAPRRERARLMIVGTYQAAYAAVLDHPIRHVLAELRARGRCRDLVLDYLSRTDVAAYLRQRFPGAAVADDVVAIVHGQAGGNPLFMTSLVDHLLARGWLTRQGDTWQLTTPAADIERVVPDTLKQLIEGQVRLLSPAERDVLEVASVAGATFEAPEVAAALGGEIDAVESTCDALCRAQRWLRDAGHRRWPDGTLAARYAFLHGLYPRVLYDRLPASRRAALHERIGTRLEAAYAGRTAEVSTELARHFETSGASRRALAYLEQAATRAYDRRAFRDVAACLESALRLSGDLPDSDQRARDELRLRRLLAVVLSHTKGYAAGDVLDNLARARVLAERLDDAGGLFDSLCALLIFHGNTGDIGQASRVSEQLSQLSERLDASAALQRDYLRGSIALWSGHLGEAADLFASAIASPVDLENAARPYAVNPVVAVRSFEGVRRWAAGEAGALAVAQEGTALAEQYGRPFTLAHAATMSGLLFLREGRPAEAARLAASAVELSAEYGFPRWLGSALVVRGAALVEQDEGQEGLRDIGEGLETLRRSGMRLGSSLMLSLLASAHLRLAHVDEALAAADAGLSYCDETGERLFEAQLWRLRGELLRRRAHPATRAVVAARGDADECFEKARAIARTQGAHGFEAHAVR